MEMPIPDIEAVYGIRPRSIIKSKYFYMISASGRLYRLYPITQTRENAERLAELNSAVCRAGVRVCPIVRTLDDENFAQLEEELFMLTYVPKGRAPDIENNEEYLKMMGLMGRFHAALRSYPVECAENMAEPYDKGLNALRNMRRIINRKNKRSEIDILFEENYSFIYELALNASDTIKTCGLGCTYAYGTPKEENFILNGTDIVLTNWNCLKVSHFLNDTAYMLKRYFKKAKEPGLTYDGLLSRYTAENPLAEEELAVLDSIMRYPEKYIAVLKEYYGKHRPFAPLYVKEKLNKELAAIYNN